METKKIKYWTCPNCNTKNVIQNEKCVTCGYDAMDDYTQEELEEMNQALNQKHEDEKNEVEPLNLNLVLIEIIIVAIAAIYVTYHIRKMLKSVNNYLNRLL